jgi:hypothetical protein
MVLPGICQNRSHPSSSSTGRAVALPGRAEAQQAAAAYIAAAAAAAAPTVTAAAAGPISSAELHDATAALLDAAELYLVSLLSRQLGANSAQLARLEAAMARLAGLAAGAAAAAVRRLATDLACVQAWEEAWQQQQQQQQQEGGGGDEDGRAAVWRAVERLMDNALK